MRSVARIAVDIGGTFTDIAVISPDGALASRKVPSTPANFADAVIRGVNELLAELGMRSEDLAEMLHGCTVATNAILELKGARTALLTTKGFRDVLELTRVRVPTLYSPLYVRPPPLVPRNLRFEIEERLDARGNVLTPLNEADVMRAVERIKAADIEAVAVCYLHSYVNDAHERATGELLRAALPGCFVSLSVDVLPQKKEYERTSTTVINCYVGPPVQHYIGSLLAQLREAGIGARLLVMQSNGGILEAESVIDHPAQIIECGPAAGVVGAQQAARHGGLDDIITLDMGGTTAKASIVVDGELIYSDGYEVGGGMSSRSALAGGGGYALGLPVIEISEIGAGGGSIAWLDKAGALKIGPQSAGAVPGPACYGAGNERPTVTDANVVLGYLNPSALAGGTVLIDAELARQAVQTHIATPMQRGVMETAYGIHTVVNANMMKAVKAVTTYRGRDPRDFALFAFGGNGGVHAAGLAKVLQIKRIVLPIGAGIFSAVGLLGADFKLDRTVPFLHPAKDLPLLEAERHYAALAEGIAAVLGDGGALRLERLVDARFAGQAFELTIPAGAGPLDASAIEALCDRFAAEHTSRYGHAFGGDFPVEVVNLRLVGRRTPEGTRQVAPKPPAMRTPSSARPVYFGPEYGAVGTPVITRWDLSARPRRGPLVIEEYEGTAVVPPDAEASLDAAGNIVMELLG